MHWETCPALLWGVGCPGGPSPLSMGLTGCSPLQSETCSVEIPELEFELGMGALGGKFTTLEGLLKDIRDLVSDPGPAWGAQPPPCPSQGWLGGLAASQLPHLPLQVEKNPFTLGDSSTPSRTGKLQEFIGKLQDVSLLWIFHALHWCQKLKD